MNTEVCRGKQRQGTRATTFMSSGVCRRHLCYVISYLRSSSSTPITRYNKQNTTCEVGLHHLAFHTCLFPRCWSRVFQFRVFRPCVFDRPALSSLAFSAPTCVSSGDRASLRRNRDRCPVDNISNLSLPRQRFHQVQHSSVQRGRVRR